MEKAAARVLRAVAAREPIAIFADYDVDGGASAALLLTWLRALDRQATLYIPDRIDEGYGPNVPAMQALAARHSLILCVDCGTLSHDPIAAAAPADGGAGPPPCRRDPARRPCRGEPQPAGRRRQPGASLRRLGRVPDAGEANRQLRATGAPTPDLMALLDLVALATVADVAPLTGSTARWCGRG